MIFLAKFSHNPERNDRSAPINENIKAPKVRLIGVDGNPVGIVAIEDALAAAADAGLDLVMVANDATPPVCKILDYGKHKYEQQKKQADSRKKQKTVTIKEVQLRPFISENDLLVKCRAIKKFIENGDRVKIVMRYRGRELSRKETGNEIIKKVLDFCSECAKTEGTLKQEGSSVMIMLCKK